MRIRHSIFRFYLLVTVVSSTQLFAQDYRVPFRDKNLWGLADTSGKLMVEATYDSIVYEGGSNRWLVSSGGKLGIINNDGETIIPMLYDNIFFIPINSTTHYHLMLLNGIASRADMYGNPKVKKKYINTESEDFIFSKLKKSNNSILWTVKDCDIVNATRTGDKKSESPPPPMLYPDEVYVTKSEVVELDTKRGMILKYYNTKFTKVVDTIPPIYDEIKVLQCSGDYYFLKKDEKWGIYDLKKRALIIPIEYDSVAIINRQLDIGLYKSGKLGFLGYSEYGNYTTYIQPEYDSIRTYISIESIKKKNSDLEIPFGTFGVIWFLREGKICPVGQNGVEFFSD